MGSVDKAKNAAQRAKGKVEELAGRVADDPRLRRKGKADQLRAKVKRTGEKVKDALRP